MKIKEDTYWWNACTLPRNFVYNHRQPTLHQSMTCEHMRNQFCQAGLTPSVCTSQPSRLSTGMTQVPSAVKYLYLYSY